MTLTNLKISRTGHTKELKTPGAECHGPVRVVNRHYGRQLFTQLSLHIRGYSSINIIAQAFSHTETDFVRKCERIWTLGSSIRNNVRGIRCTIEGFHVTSYQANFASHRTRDRHVGFLYNKMSRYFLFSSCHVSN